MAIKLTDKLQAVTVDGVIVDASQVAGGYMSVADKSTIGDALKVDGMLIFETSTEKSFRWDSSSASWVEQTDAATVASNLSTHVNNTTGNPHNVTKANVGLSNVVNTGDSATPVSGGTTKFTTGGAYTELNKKVDKVSGKGLSTNDYTTAEKNKLAGIAEGANNYTHPNSGATEGSYTKVTVDAKGHVTGGSNPTTLAGYGITDAEPKGAAQIAQDEAALYTDEAMEGLAQSFEQVIGHIYGSDMPDGEFIGAKTIRDIAADESGKVSSNLSSHTGNTTVHITANERTKWNTHAEAAHAPSNAEKNQNAFSNVKVGSTTVAADSVTDTLELVAGTNVTITPDATNDKITISAKDTVYTHPSHTAASEDLYKVTVNSSGHVTKTTKVTKSDITNLGIPAQDTTYSAATTSAAGLMSAADKAKLDGIAAQANKYSLPEAGSSLGGVKTGGDVTISNGIITVNDDSHNHVIGNIDGLQSALDGKAPAEHSHSYIPTSEKGAASGVATLDTSGKIPQAQLPSYVDDIIEGYYKSADKLFYKESSYSTLITGETGKIYVDLSTNKTYRWGGSTSKFVVISETIAIGTTTGTALDGKVGNDHITNTNNPHGVTKAQVGLGSVVNTGDSATPVLGGTTKFTTGGAYTELNKKVDKVDGKGLSTNDYTTAEKNKLAGIASGAEVNVQSDWNVTDTSSDAFIKNKPTLGTLAAKSTVAKSDLATDVQTSLGKADTALQSFTESDPTVPSWAKAATKPSYNLGEVADTTAYVRMTAAERTKLSGVATGATKITVDSALSSTSTNPVQNKVVNSALAGKADSSHTHTKSQITDFPALATVATTGSYNDLSNKPTIPTVNNGTLTIQKNGTNVATFSANQSGNVTANIVVPTKVSDLTNDSGFKTVDTNTTYDLAATKSSNNGNVKLNLTAGGSGSGTDSVTIKGSGATTVTTDADGVITVTSSNDHLDTEVKLSADLKTYYNVGKITTASGTNPVTIGTAGQTLRKVFENLFSMDEVQPTITENPSVTCSLTNADASDERGTVISSASYSITFKDGAYTNAGTTGVKMTSYSFSSGTASSTTSTTGTLTFASSYTVGTSSAIQPTLTANYSAGNVAKTNLGNNSNPVVKIAASSCTATPSFSKTAVDYPYFISDSADTVAKLSGKTFSKKSTNLTTTTGVSCNYNKDAYVWIFIRKGITTTQPSKKIQAYSDIAKAWGNFLEDTQLMGTITFNKANGVSDTFFAYRTKNVAQAADSATFRLN